MSKSIPSKIQPRIEARKRFRLSDTQVQMARELGMTQSATLRPIPRLPGRIIVMDATETSSIPADWLAEFEAAARRLLALRLKYAFIRTCKPVMDDEKFRAFDTMEEYCQWCEKNLPDWLGYGRVGRDHSSK